MRDKLSLVADFAKDEAPKSLNFRIRISFLHAPAGGPLDLYGRSFVGPKFSVTRSTANPIDFNSRRGSLVLGGDADDSPQPFVFRTRAVGRSYQLLLEVLVAEEEDSLQAIPTPAALPGIPTSSGARHWQLVRPGAARAKAKAAPQIPAVAAKVAVKASPVPEGGDADPAPDAAANAAAAAAAAAAALARPGPGRAPAAAVAAVPPSSPGLVTPPALAAPHLLRVGWAQVRFDAATESRQAPPGCEDLPSALAATVAPQTLADQTGPSITVQPAAKALPPRRALKLRKGSLRDQLLECGQRLADAPLAEVDKVERFLDRSRAAKAGYIDVDLEMLPLQDAARRLLPAEFPAPVDVPLGGFRSSDKKKSFRRLEVTGDAEADCTLGNFRITLPSEGWQQAFEKSLLAPTRDPKKTKQPPEPAESWQLQGMYVLVCAHNSLRWLDSNAQRIVSGGVAATCPHMSRDGVTFWRLDLARLSTGTNGLVQWGCAAQAPLEVALHEDCGIVMELVAELVSSAPTTTAGDKAPLLGESAQPRIHQQRTVGWALLLPRYHTYEEDFHRAMPEVKGKDIGLVAYRGLRLHHGPDRSPSGQEVWRPPDKAHAGATLGPLLLSMTLSCNRLFAWLQKQPRFRTLVKKTQLCIDVFKVSELVHPDNTGDVSTAMSPRLREPRLKAICVELALSNRSQETEPTKNPNSLETVVFADEHLLFQCPDEKVPDLHVTVWDRGQYPNAAAPVNPLIGTRSLQMTAEFVKELKSRAQEVILPVSRSPTGIPVTGQVQLRLGILEGPQPPPKPVPKSPTVAKSPATPAVAPAAAPAAKAAPAVATAASAAPSPSVAPASATASPPVPGAAPPAVPTAPPSPAAVPAAAAPASPKVSMPATAVVVAKPAAPTTPSAPATPAPAAPAATATAAVSAPAKTTAVVTQPGAKAAAEAKPASSAPAAAPAAAVPPVATAPAAALAKTPPTATAAVATATPATATAPVAAAASAPAASGAAVVPPVKAAPKVPAALATTKDVPAPKLPPELQTVVERVFLRDQGTQSDPPPRPGADDHIIPEGRMPVAWPKAGQAQPYNGPAVLPISHGDRTRLLRELGDTGAGRLLRGLLPGTAAAGGAPRVLRLKLEQDDPLQADEFKLEFLTHRSIATALADRVFFQLRFFLFPPAKTPSSVLVGGTGEPCLLRSAVTQEPLSLLYHVDGAAASKGAPHGKAMANASDVHMQLVEYLSVRCAEVEVWNLDSAMQIGVVIIPLDGLVRQGKVVSKLEAEHPILDPMTGEARGFLKVLLQVRGRQPQWESPALSAPKPKGAGPVPPPLNDSVLDLSAISCIRDSPRKKGPKRVKAGVLVSGTITAGLQVTDPEEQNQKEQRLRQLRVLRRLDVTDRASDEHVALINRAEEARQARKREEVKQRMERFNTIQISVPAPFATPYFFTVEFENPFNHQATFGIVTREPSAEAAKAAAPPPAAPPAPPAHGVLAAVPDPPLTLVQDPEEWKRLVAERRLMGPPGGNFSFFVARNVFTLGPREVVCLPFRYLAFDHPGMHLKDAPSSGLALADAAQGGAPDRDFTIEVMQQQGPVLKRAEVTCTPQPCVIDQTIRFFEAEGTPLEKSMALPPRPAGAMNLSLFDPPQRAVAENDGRFVYCTDREIHVQRSGEDEITLNMVAPLAPASRWFFIISYSDQYFAWVIAIQLVEVQGLKCEQVRVIAGKSEERSISLPPAEVQDAPVVRIYASDPEIVTVQQAAEVDPRYGAKFSVVVTAIQVGARLCRLHAVDPVTKRLIAAFLLVIAADLPEVKVVHDLSLPVLETVRKRLPYLNELTREMRYSIRSSEPALVSVQTPELMMEARQSRPIELLFHACPSTFSYSAEVFIFIASSDRAIQETRLLQLTYT